MSGIMVVASFAPSLLSFRGELLRMLVRDGHRVIACAPEVDPDVCSALDVMGVEFRPVLLDRVGMNPLKDFRTLILLIKLLREVKPQIVFSYTIKPIIYGSFAARVAGVPYIFSMVTGLGNTFSRTGWKGRLVGFLVATLYRLALRFNGKVFFQNPDDRNFFFLNRLLDKSKPTVVVNGSGVDLDFYCPGPFPDQPTFLLVSRLVRDKGIPEYAEAARQLKNRFPHSRFLLVGWFDDNPNGVAPEELDAWVKSGYIEYLGALKDVRPAILASSVYVLPSCYGEGVPRTILEAMAIGRPIVTTDAPGCRETVVPGINGFLVPVHDVDRLVAVMTIFIQEPALIAKMGLASREIAVRKFDVHKVNGVIMKAMGSALDSDLAIS